MCTAKKDLAIEEFISSITSSFDLSNPKTCSEVTFDINSSFEVISTAMNIFKKEPTTLQIDAKSKISDFVIVGDLHGSLESLLQIFEKKGTPETTPYLFLGDYVDRGANSCEVIMLLYSYKCLYPDNIYLIRGNHEFRYINEQYGFKKECFNRIKQTINGKIKNKGADFYKKVTKTYKFLPLCAIINDNIFCVHGGVTGFISSRRELLRIEKVYSKSSLFLNGSVSADFLWNDPDPNIQTQGMSPRQLGHTFGRKILNDFKKSLNFCLVIRGHEMAVNGYDWPFGREGGILTVFSAPNYCGGSNGSAVAIIRTDGTVDVEQIVPNTSLRPLANLNEIKFM